MELKDVKRRLMKDPEFAREYEALGPEYELVRSIIDRRIAKRMTQSELAERIGSKQPVISRLEGGGSKPSLSLLERVADALDATVVVRLEPRKPQRKRVSTSARGTSGHSRRS